MDAVFGSAVLEDIGSFFVLFFNFLFALFIETESHQADQTGLEILLPRPAKCWDFKSIPSHLA